MANFHLGLHLGSNSIGWAVCTTDNPFKNRFRRITGIARTGVRVFPDGRTETGTTLAEERRLARSARRNRDRALQRQRGLQQLLIKAGLLPANKTEAEALLSVCPLELRHKALEEPLTPHLFGRALWHLAKRRGPSWGRGEEGDDPDAGLLKAAQGRLRTALALEGARTLGEFLHSRKLEGTRFRRNNDPKIGWDIYPSRDLIRAEWELLWDTQTKLGLSVPALARDKITKIAFNQRPLRRQQPGRCTLIPEDLRLPKSLPTSETRIIYETLGQLRVMDDGLTYRPLTREERDNLASVLLEGRDLTWAGVRRTAKLSKTAAFNLDHGATGTRNGIGGAQTAKIMSSEKAFGELWHGFNLPHKDTIVSWFHDLQEAEDIAGRLTAKFNWSAEKAEALAQWKPRPGYGRLGKTISDKLIAEYIADPACVYSEACERAGFDHSQLGTGEVFDRLPYYGIVLDTAITETPANIKQAEGEIGSRGARRARGNTGLGAAEIATGKIRNPSVHAALNQLQKLVNELIEEFGPIDSINVSIGRDLKMTPEDQRTEAIKNYKNQKQNKERELRIEEAGYPITHETKLRARLFDEQCNKAGDCFCPLTLKSIGFKDALGSHAIVATHITPFNLSLNDSPSNLMLAYAHAARLRGGKTNFDTFAHDEIWPAIIEHSNSIGKFRQRLTAPPPKKGDEDPLAHHLVDTQYFARLAAQYLRCLGADVTPISTRVAPLLRRAWSIHKAMPTNTPKEHDYRSKAVDAVIVACTSRANIEALSRANADSPEELQKELRKIMPPIDDLANKIQDQLQSLIVSHKPEHGRRMKFFTDTAYGIRDNATEGDYNLVTRKSITAFTIGDVKKVNDERLKQELEVLGEKHPGPQDFAKALQNWAASHASAGAGRQPIRRLRIGAKSKSYEAISNKRGRPTALIKDALWALDIFQRKDLSWDGEGIAPKQANDPKFRPAWEQEKVSNLLVMRLHKGDIFEAVDRYTGQIQLFKVQRLIPSNGKIKATHLHEAGKLTVREKEGTFKFVDFSYRQLRDQRAKKVKVSVSGRVQYAKLDKQIPKSLNWPMS